MILLELEKPVDKLCDYTYGFCWSSNFDRDSIIPHQKDSSYTYRDVVEALKAGETVHVKGDTGEQLAHSMGASIEHLGGSGDIEDAGTIIVDGNVGTEAAMGMVSGTLYISGKVAEPMGNVIEVKSDREGYRKFVSITDLLCNNRKETVISNQLEGKTLILSDNVNRGTIAARCNCDVEIRVKGDVYNGCGLLMRKGILIIEKNAGMNTAAHLDGGTVVVKGKCGEFAGAFMKNGYLLAEEVKGYAGADMKGGVILTHKKANISPPAKKGKLDKQDINLLKKYLGAGMFASVQYNKYEASDEGKYITIKMRDGSFVRRKVE
ncbi:formylmethanofuran dehydrogenase [Methanohalophilus sp.]|uniref:formylmethanofuran dehydrogenase n=1 Tax=Methanohalophilus sp. TaxID=1966352 RepID=UPI00262D9813|nr:formylmethanofuran dehydrogenase [Methanohalophilus sp.]MDK2891761.1 hypothetical protein [Methanohalophilus sp.]